MYHSIYTYLLKEQLSIINIEQPMPNFFLVRVAGRTYFPEIYNIVLCPSEWEPPHPKYEEFTQWYKQEFGRPLATCDCIEDDDEYYYDQELFKDECDELTKQAEHKTLRRNNTTKKQLKYHY